MPHHALVFVMTALYFALTIALVEASRQNPPDYVSQEYAAQLRRLLRSSCQHSVCADDVVAAGVPSPRYRPDRRRQYGTGSAVVVFPKGVGGPEGALQETTSRQSHSDLATLRPPPRMGGQCLTTVRAAGASVVSDVLVQSNVGYWRPKPAPLDDLHRADMKLYS